MPRILRILNRFNLGGPTYNAAYLTKYLQPEFETLLVAGMKDDSEESSLYISKKLGIEPVLIPEMKREIDIKNDLKAYKRIKQLIEEFKPDIVHTHAAKAGTIGRLAASNSGVPVIVHTFHGHVFHSYFGAVKTRMFIEIEKYLARKSTGIVAISSSQKQELAMKFNICHESKITVIPLGFDLMKFGTKVEGKRNEFRKRYFISNDEIVIAIVGRLVSIKNHKMFIRGFKNLMNKTPQKIRALIVGDGEEMAQIKEFASSIGVQYECDKRGKSNSPLIFTSWIKEMDYVMAGVDIIALTSLNEGTPVSLIEAQAAKKAIVSTDVGGVKDTVIPNESAFLVDKEDENQFTLKLLELIKDKNLREMMGKKGQNFVTAKFTYERLANDFRKYYNHLLA